MVVLFGTGMLISCTPASMSVLVDYDKEAPFNQYQTYYWSDNFEMENGITDNPIFYNSLNKKRIKKAIKEEMEKRGFRMEKSEPDLLINAKVVIDERNIEYGYSP